MRFIIWGVLAAASSIGAAATPLPTYRVIERLPAGDGGWDLLSVAAGDQRVYVARTDGVTAVDLRTGKVTDKIVPGQRVHAALAIPGTHEVVSTNGETNTATLFDGRDGKIRAVLTTGTKPDAAAWDPSTRTVWVMNPGSGDITVIDPAAAKVIATLPVGGSLELGVADGRGRMFVNVEDKNELAILDTRRRTMIKRVALAGCEAPTGIAYDPVSQQIVSACSDNARAIISTRNGSKVASLAIGSGADGAAFDRARRVALVPAGRSGNITLIRLSPKPAVVGVVPTAVSARTIAIDDGTGRAYLPSAELAPAVGNQRSKPVPGSFRLLVVGP